MRVAIANGSFSHSVNVAIDEEDGEQGISMTKPWKSGTSNCASGGIVKGIAYLAMAMLKLPVYKTAGRIERECDVAPKVLGREAECVVKA